MALTAPRDAIVLSVAKISVGSVVTSAEPLIQLVPIDAPLSVEADISGIESGYVSPGDEVRIKFDTLPFLQYGTARGVVRTISADSFSPDTTPPGRRLDAAEQAEHALLSGRHLAGRSEPAQHAGGFPPHARHADHRGREGRHALRARLLHRSDPSCCLRGLARALRRTAWPPLTYSPDHLTAWRRRSPRRARSRAERLSAAAPNAPSHCSRRRPERAMRTQPSPSASAISRAKGFCATRSRPRVGIVVAAEVGHARAQCRLAQLHLLGVPRAAVGSNAGLFEPVEAGTPIITRP